MAAVEIGCDWLPCWFLEVLADPMAAWFSWLARDLFGLQSLRGPAGCACWAGRTCLMPMARVSVVRRLPGCTSSFIFEYSPAVSEGDGAVRSSCGVMGDLRQRDPTAARTLWRLPRRKVRLHQLQGKPRYNNNSNGKKRRSNSRTKNCNRSIRFLRVPQGFWRFL